MIIMNLKIKLIILLILVGILPLIILSFISYDLSQKIIIEQISQQLIKCSEELKEKINNLIQEKEIKIERLANNENFLLWAKNEPQKKEKVDFLKDIFYLNFDYFLKINPEFKNILYITEQQEIKINLINKNVELLELLNIDESKIYFLRTNKNNQNEMYFLNKIVFEKKLFGWLIFEFDLNNILEKLNTIKLSNFKSFKIMLFSDKMNKLILETQQNIQKQNLEIKKITSKKLMPQKINNKSYIVYKDNFLDWTYLFLIERNEILQPIFYLRNTAIILTIITIIILIILALIVGNNFVKPILLLTKSATTIAAGNLNEKIPVHSKDEIGILAHNFEIMRETIKNHIEELDKKVLERTKAITDLLNNAGQGFLTINQNLLINKEYSKQCIDFIGCRIENKNILEILYPDIYNDYKTNPEKYDEESDIRVTNDLINDIFKNSEKVDVMLSLLPAELKINNKILTIQYVFLKDEFDERETKIMLILTDVTRERELKEKAKIEEERNNLIIKVALDKTGFIDFVRDLKNQINYARNLISTINIDKNYIYKLDELFRIIHTIKGNSPFYNLKNVAENSHKFEDYISVLIKTKTFTKKEREELNEYLDKIIEGLNYHLNSIKDFLSTDEIFKSEEKVFEISETKINSLIRLINEKLKEEDKKIILEKVKELKKYSIKFLLKRYITNAEQLAARLGKKIKITINNDDFLIDYAYLKPLFDNYIHIIRNAIDHGIEYPEERIKLKKTEFGNINIILEEIEKENKRYFKIETNDDGRGINIDRIKERIIKKKILREEEVEKLSKEELYNYIFYSGFSTKDTITDISGRGIGMDAIKEVVTKLNGEIKIFSEQNIGTSIIIFIPLED